MAMHRGAIEFEVGGQTRQIRFSINAMARFQEQRGTPFVRAVQGYREDPYDLVTLRALFWAGLADVTLDEAGDIMDDLGLQEASKVLGRAIEAAFPEAQAGDSDGAGAPEAEAGNAKGAAKKRT